MAALKLGDPAPAFALSGVDGKTCSLEGLAEKPILIVMFSCNHCPYVQAYEDRLVNIQRDYKDRGIQLVAINSNDAVNYPEDNLDQMVARAKAKSFNFPYLRDATQQVARVYGATHTPQIFVFNRERRLCYMGKIDDNWQNPQAVRRRYLREALDALLEGREPAEPSTHAIGCTIKWAS